MSARETVKRWIHTPKLVKEGKEKKRRKKLVAIMKYLILFVNTLGRLRCDVSQGQSLAPELHRVFSHAKTPWMCTNEHHITISSVNNVLLSSYAFFAHNRSLLMGAMRGTLV